MKIPDLSKYTTTIFKKIQSSNSAETCISIHVQWYWAKKKKNWIFQLAFAQQVCQDSCLMGKSALKVTCPAKKSTSSRLSDGNFFRAMNFRGIHKVPVLSIPKKATPHILCQCKLSAPYLLSIHHRGHTHRKSHGGDLADVIIKKACISYNGVFCQGLHSCPWFQRRSRFIERNMTIITNTCKNYRVVVALKSLSWVSNAEKSAAI